MNYFSHISRSGAVFSLLFALALPFSSLLAGNDFARALDQAATFAADAGLETARYTDLRSERLEIHAAAEIRSAELRRQRRASAQALRAVGSGPGLPLPASLPPGPVLLSGAVGAFAATGGDSRAGNSDLARSALPGPPAARLVGSPAGAAAPGAIAARFLRGLFYSIRNGYSGGLA